MLCVVLVTATAASAVCCAVLVRAGLVVVAAAAAGAADVAAAAIAIVCMAYTTAAGYKFMASGQLYLPLPISIIFRVAFLTYSSHVPIASTSLCRLTVYVVQLCTPPTTWPHV
jgi:hypothetical protein